MKDTSSESLSKAAEYFAQAIVEMLPRERLQVAPVAPLESPQTEAVQSFRLFKINQVAEILGVGRTTVYQFIKEGRLGIRYLGEGKTLGRISAADIQSFIDSCAADRGIGRV